MSKCDSWWPYLGTLAPLVTRTSGDQPTAGQSKTEWQLVSQSQYRSHITDTVMKKGEGNSSEHEDIHFDLNFSHCRCAHCALPSGTLPGLTFYILLHLVGLFFLLLLNLWEKREPGKSTVYRFMSHVNRLRWRSLCLRVTGDRRGHVWTELTLCLLPVETRRRNTDTQCTSVNITVDAFTLWWTDDKWRQMTNGEGCRSTHSYSSSTSDMAAAKRRIMNQEDNERHRRQ